MRLSWKTLLEIESTDLDPLCWVHRFFSILSIFAKIGYLYTLGMIGVQALSVIFFIFQAWTSGDRAQEKLKDFVNNGVKSGI